MTEKETVKIFAVLTAAYPNFDKFDNLDKARPIIELWAEMFADTPYPIVETAVKKLILESPYPPTIADVRKRIAEIQYPELKSGADAWNEVSDAVRKYGLYGKFKALKSMDELTRRVVNSIGFRNICISDNPMADRAHFLKLYSELAKRERDKQLIPEKLKKQINKLSAKMNVKKIGGTA